LYRQRFTFDIAGNLTGLFQTGGAGTFTRSFQIVPAPGFHRSTIG
jgi:hypothetical protein